MKKRFVFALCVSCFAPMLAAGQSPGPLNIAVILSRNSPVITSRARMVENAALLTHVVQQGDTLYGISLANNVSVRTLIRINHLPGNRLKIGQRLLIALPEDAVSRRGRKSEGLAGSKRVSEKPVTAVGDTATTEDSDPGSSPEIALRSSEALVKDSSTEGEEEETELSLPGQLVQAGLDFLGVPYRWRGMSVRRGVDCSGLVKTLFDKFQIELPHSAREQYKLGERVARAELAVGDLVFFSTRGRIPTHVGIYIGDNRFIHAARKAGQVIISNLSQSWYQRNFVGARRISDLWKDGQKPPEAKGN
jgi:peptidoglycan DL-endopeptidase LytE